jgi:hypothetical protein
MAGDDPETVSEYTGLDLEQPCEIAERVAVFGWWA